MTMMVAGMNTVPWDLIAVFAENMLAWLSRPGTPAWTFDSFYLKVGLRVGMHVGVRLLTQQEGMDYYLGRGENPGALNPVPSR